MSFAHHAAKPYLKLLKHQKSYTMIKRFLNSKNKMKATWNIIKSEKGKKASKGGLYFLNINGKLTNNQKMTANSLNNYLLTTADKIIGNRNDKIGQSNNKNPLNYMFQIFKHLFLVITFNYTSTKRLKKLLNV
jgi:hypothetical protein